MFRTAEEALIQFRTDGPATRERFLLPSSVFQVIRQIQESADWLAARRPLSVFLVLWSSPLLRGIAQRICLRFLPKQRNPLALSSRRQSCSPQRNRRLRLRRPAFFAPERLHPHLESLPSQEQSGCGHNDSESRRYDAPSLSVLQQCFQNRRIERCTSYSLHL